MKRIQISKSYFLDEYLPKDLYLRYEKNHQILIGLIDERLIKADQALRDKFGSVIINNWYNGGDRNWSGLRTSDSPYYSPTSQHCFGRASDKLFTVPSEEVRKFILQNWKNLGITCIEGNVSWVHTDCRLILQQKELLIVYPK